MRIISIPEIIGQYEGYLKGLFVAGGLILVILISLLTIVIEQKLLGNKENKNILCRKILNLVIKNSENPFPEINKILSQNGIIVTNLQSNAFESGDYIEVEMAIKVPAKFQNTDIENILSEEIELKEIKCK